MIAKRTRSSQKKRHAVRLFSFFGSRFCIRVASESTASAAGPESSPKKEKKRTNVRRSLFSEIGLLTQSRTRLDDGNAVPSRDAKAKKSPQSKNIVFSCKRRGKHDF